MICNIIVLKSGINNVCNTSNSYNDNHFYEKLTKGSPEQQMSSLGCSINRSFLIEFNRLFVE